MRIVGALLLGYAALNTYLLLKVNPLPISFMPRFAADGDNSGDQERVPTRLAA
ncbi:MAG TPA: hypothetical protein VMR52_06540 [Dehalococcoidia bacterium]|nr:hypothetical protein [Dehalococcoidia bacterium]